MRPNRLRQHARTRRAYGTGTLFQRQNIFHHFLGVAFRQVRVGRHGDVAPVAGPEPGVVVKETSIFDFGCSPRWSALIYFDFKSLCPKPQTKDLVSGLPPACLTIPPANDSLTTLLQVVYDPDGPAQVSARHHRILRGK